MNECVVAGWLWMHWRKSFAGSVLDHSIGKISVLFGVLAWLKLFWEDLRCSQINRRQCHRRKLKLDHFGNIVSTSEEPFGNLTGDAWEES